MLYMKLPAQRILRHANTWNENIEYFLLLLDPPTHELMRESYDRKHCWCPTSTHPFFTKEQQVMKIGYIKCAQLNRAFHNSGSITHIGYM